MSFNQLPRFVAAPPQPNVSQRSGQCDQLTIWFFGLSFDMRGKTGKGCGLQRA
jgi:hypothetical protein